MDASEEAAASSSMTPTEVKRQQSKHDELKARALPFRGEEAAMPINMRHQAAEHRAALQAEARVNTAARANARVYSAAATRDGKIQAKAEKLDAEADRKSVV